MAATSNLKLAVFLSYRRTKYEVHWMTMWPFEIAQDGARRYLGFGPTGSSAIRFSNEWKLPKDEQYLCLKLNRTICLTVTVLPFTQSAHAVTIVRHSMDVAKSTVEQLNPDQTSVTTFDRILLALAKQI